MPNTAEPLKSASSQALRIDELCDQFEAAIQAGKKPQIDEYVERATEDQRAALLAELTLLTTEYQQKQVARPAVTIQEPRRAMQVGNIDSTIAHGDTPKTGDPLSPISAVVLCVLNGPNQGQQFTLQANGAYLAGRGTEAQLPLPPTDKSISRAHFQLELSLPRCLLINLSKTNTTLVNGQPVTEFQLRHGDIVLVGDTALRVAINRHPAA